MVVTIKEHRYDVDFDDVRVIAAADDGKRAIVEAHASLPPVTDAGYGKRLIDWTSSRQLSTASLVTACPPSASALPTTGETS